jgi:hypothetical protein
MAVCLSEASLQPFNFRIPKANVQVISCMLPDVIITEFKFYLISLFLLLFYLGTIYEQKKQYAQINQ